MESCSRAVTFNQPLDSWDVSGVTDLNNLFNGAESFNHPLNNWDVALLKWKESWGC